MKTIQNTLIVLALMVSIQIFGQVPTLSGFSPSGGPAGTVVTLSGNNLSSPTSVSIGGSSAIIISSTNTSIVAMSMAASGSGPVSVTTAGGSVNAAGSFNGTADYFPSIQKGPKLTGSGATGVNAGAVDTSMQGWAVAISADGNTALVGGPADADNTGAVWTYTRSAGVWSQMGAKLVGTGGVGGSRQGTSVALSADGKTAIVGGVSDNGSIGAAWVFTRSGNTWIQQGSKLVGTGAAGASQQGTSVSLSADGNTAIVGAYGDNNFYGAAWIYTRSGGSWTQQGSKLVGTGAVYNQYIFQGHSVSISADGNTAIVGGDYDNTQNGAAWVYTRSGGVWTQSGNKLVGTGAVGTAYQGSSVAISADGNTAIVGGPGDNGYVGASWVYSRSGNTFTQQGSKLTISGVRGLGTAISLTADGNIAVVGAAYDNTNIGALVKFIRSGGTWTQEASKLIPTGHAGGSAMGFALSTTADGFATIAGGYQDSSYYGAAWIFVDSADVPSAGPDQTVCSNQDTIIMNATGTGTWSALPTNPSASTFIGPTSPNAFVVCTHVIGGIYGYVWTSGSYTDTMYVTVLTSPATPGLRVTGSGCLGHDTIIASGIPATAGTLWGANGFFAHSGDTMFVPTSLQNGSNVTVEYTAANGCVSRWSNSVSVVLCANAGPNRTLSCVLLPGGSVTMAAVGSGTWTADTLNPGTALITNPNSPNTSITAFTAPGNYVFIWNTTAGIDMAQVSVTARPNAGSDTIVPISGAAHLSAIDVVAGTWSALSSNPGSSTIVTPPSRTTLVQGFAGTGVYSYIFTDLYGCTDTVSVHVVVVLPDSVWPGDADHNGIADNNDLLPIGTGYGLNGFTRPDQSVVWSAHYAQDWGLQFLSGANAKHADCNGDAVIDANDTVAIMQNFGLTHSKTRDYPGPWRSGIPGIRLHFSKDTVAAGDTLITSLILGDSATTVSNIYGLAFTYHYDPLVVDTASISFTFINSFIGNSTDKISIHKDFRTDGTVKAAVTGINHLGRSGYGAIAYSRSIITTDNINGKDLSYYANLAYISDITAIDKDQNPISLNTGIDSNQVAYTPTGIREMEKVVNLMVFPNPANGQVTALSQYAIQQIVITDMLGQPVLSESVGNKKCETIDVSALLSGVYSIHVSTALGTGTSKIIITR